MVTEDLDRRSEREGGRERLIFVLLHFSPEFWLATPPHDESDFKPDTVSFPPSLSLPPSLPPSCTYDVTLSLTHTHADDHQSHQVGV